MQKRRDREELTSEKEIQKNKLEAASKNTARLEEAMREYEESQSTRRGLSERRNRTGRGWVREAEYQKCGGEPDL